MHVIKSLVLIGVAAATTTPTALRGASALDSPILPNENFVYLDHVWNDNPNMPQETYGIPRGNTYKYFNTLTGNVECGRVPFNTFPDPASQVPVLGSCSAPLATNIDTDAITGLTDEVWGFGQFVLLDRAPDIRGLWRDSSGPRAEVIEQCGNRVTIREDENNTNRAWIHDFVELNGEFRYGCVDYLVRAFPACETIVSRAFWGTSDFVDFRPCHVGVNSLGELGAVRCLNPEDGTLTFFNPTVHGSFDNADIYSRVEGTCTNCHLVPPQ